MKSPASDSTRRVAVIDIGSNSIKLLVAATGGHGLPVELFRQTEETRIGTGIGDKARHGLREDAIRAALQAIRNLLAAAAPHEPGATAIVATSAVRDAPNRSAFAAAVECETGVPLRILSGADEARYIGLGIRCDPVLRETHAFYLFDLGGGSLECLAFHEGEAVAVISLDLGCVRLMERFLPDPARPLAPAIEAAVRDEVARNLTSAFAFPLPTASPVVVTGGTAAVARALLPVLTGETTPPETIALPAWRKLRARLGQESLADRLAWTHLPPNRADVIPTAMIILEEVARLAGVESFRHSFFNLRFGLARELLAGPV
ncbi:MAG: phosphatase [Puniceicoccaceae bacterium]|nr:MAG: phosphatase [Puniceicoccaceae bacterium]